MISPEHYSIIQKYLKMAEGCGDLPHGICDEVIANIKPAKYLNRNEAAKYIGCSLVHLDRLARQGVLHKHYVSPRFPVFIQDELEATIRNQGALK